MRSVSAALFVLLASLGACGAPHPRARTAETVGGSLRSRPFASATAYEAFLRAELALREGDAALAVGQFELALLADNADPWLAARRAEVLLRAGQREEAQEAATQATRRFPQDAAPWLALAELRLAQRDATGATEALSRALAAAGDDAEVRAEVARLQGPEGGSLALTPLRGSLSLERLTTERPLLRSRRRERAEQALRRGAWREVDALLGALAREDPRAVPERLLLLEARLAEGRAAEARPLVALLPLGAPPAGVSAAERARLWLRVGSPAEAEEDARRGLQAEPDSVDALAVLAVARLEQGDLGEGLRSLGRVPPEAGVFVEAWQGATRVLGRRGEHALAARFVEAALRRLERSAPLERDRLRVALAASWLEASAVAQAHAVLARVEGPWGRQRRAMLLAGHAAPEELLRDLRERTEDPGDDGWADAWRAMLCFAQRAPCGPGEAQSALSSAREHAPGALETRRAEALAAGDRRALAELAREEPWRVVGPPGVPWRRLRAGMPREARPAQ